MTNTVKKFCRMISHFVSVSFIFITFRITCTMSVQVIQLTFASDHSCETIRLERVLLDLRKPLYPIAERLKGYV